MLKRKRQMFIGTEAVINHFSFTPPLIASTNLKNEACFIFPINTVGKIYRTDGKQEVSKQQGVLMRCGSYINKWQPGDLEKDSEVVIIRLLPEILDRIIDHDFKNTIKNNLAAVSRPPSAVVIKLDLLLSKYLDSLMFYFENPEVVSEEIVLLKLRELSLLLINSASSNPIKELFFRLFEPVEFSLREIVDANYKENLSLAELARLANMSISTFKRKFKQLIGESPGSYIRNKRLDWTFHELRHTNRPIGDIAYEAGFQNANYFSKSFSKKYGVSPRRSRMN